MKKKYQIKFLRYSDESIDEQQAIKFIHKVKNEMWKQKFWMILPVVIFIIMLLLLILAHFAETGVL